jgi:hypothetical protein
VSRDSSERVSRASTRSDASVSCYFDWFFGGVAGVLASRYGRYWLRVFLDRPLRKAHRVAMPGSQTHLTEVDPEALLTPRSFAERLIDPTPSEADPTESDPTEPEPVLVSVAVAKNLLGGISTSYTYELLARGQLQSVSLGRRRLVVRSSIDELVNRLAAEAAV